MHSLLAGHEQYQRQTDQSWLTGSPPAYLHVYTSISHIIQCQSKAHMQLPISH